jgi:hypothetical protein
MHVLTLLLLLAAGPGEGHRDNLAFQQLLRTGIEVAPRTPVKLPPPTLADGLNARQQQEVLRTVAGEDYDVEELLRNSVVSPQVLRLGNPPVRVPNGAVRSVDLWFIVHGDLAVLQSEEFIRKLAGLNEKSGKGKELTPEELARRGIRLSKAEAEHTRFGNVQFTFLDRVELQATGSLVWSKTPDSVVVAVHIDPRFTRDADHPNRWRSLIREEDTVKPGPPHPYEGFAYYAKVTRLTQPPGALLVEMHGVFVEPTGWFDGANLLRSKLPPALQQQVRTLRRELLKASPGSAPRD